MFSDLVTTVALPDRILFAARLRGGYGSWAIFKSSTPVELYSASTVIEAANAGHAHHGAYVTTRSDAVDSVRQRAGFWANV